MAEYGHYGGRTAPTATRQGTYALTPSGKFLASINSNDPKQMSAMLRRALDAWNVMSREDRLGPADPLMEISGSARFERFYPVNGLVLRVLSRDIARDSRANDWRASAWNLDYAWFNETEARQFMSYETPKAGQVHQVPAALSRRLTRLNFVDNVRGQTSHFEESQIKTSEITTTVTEIKGKDVFLKITGKSAAVASGTWSVNGFRDMNSPSQQTRGIELGLIGKATYDTLARKFTAFEVVAAGTRWGATQYNGRHDDPGPAPIGYLVTKAGDSAQEKVAPTFWWAYPWR